jgi:hypothetical protein
MATTYAGNAANYPTSVTIPSDGDGPGIKALDVNAAFEGLADRTANLKNFLGYLPGQNFRRADAAYEPRVAVWDGSGTAFVAVDNSGVPVLKWSASYGQADVPFDNVTLTGAVSGDSITVGDSDNAGGLFFAGVGVTGWSIISGWPTTPSATRVAAVHADGARNQAAVAYDPIRDKWLYAAGTNAGGGGAAVYTVRVSSDRTTWGAAAGSTGATDTDSLTVAAANKTTGRIVLMSRKGATQTIRVNITDDCGTTFSAQTDITFTLASPTYTSLTWSQDYGKFFFVISKASESELWTSTDGTAWTLAFSSANWGLQRVASYGRMLVAQLSANNGMTAHVVSLDGGVTWISGAFAPPGNPKGVYRTPYGFVALTSSTGGSVGHSAYFSEVMGPPANFFIV